jgi:hypothetical protein
MLAELDFLSHNICIFDFSGDKNIMKKPWIARDFSLKYDFWVFGNRNFLQHPGIERKTCT